LTERPLLAVVPRGAFSAEKLSKLEEESFHMLRSALMFFNVDRQLSTVLVTSPVKGDGKTTVATHLAIAAAQGGHNVILVDADMRRPQAATRLHVAGEATQPGHGLAGVLSAQCSLAQALVDVPIGPGDDKDAAPAELQGTLRLLPAGGVPPNPSELLSSLRMPGLLGELQETADFVVIDTTPLLSVSDALPLFDSVSGVVLVARLHSTTRDAIRRFQKIIGNTNATVLGVVATGAASGGFYGRYGYGYGYGYYGYGSTAYANGNGNGTRGAGRFRRRRRREKQTS
jgi:receptor protein-tyrosine kinase